MLHTNACGVARVHQTDPRKKPREPGPRGVRATRFQP